MKNILFFFLFQISFYSFAQEVTVGLIYNDETSSLDGYTLIAPTGSTDIYLIDNCGKKVHEWNSSDRSGLSTYLLENGVLLRTEKASGSFFGGGIGGKIKMIDWDGTLIWNYTLANEDFHQHHDVEYLPNGNVLVIAWERISEEDILEKGRLPDTVDENIWLTSILEIEPQGLEGGEIVWEWHLVDHLSQDVDDTKENFGVVSEHPERVNINYNLNASGLHGPEDWIHANAIDYNANLDQIIISSRYYGEAWIIDHSTTSEEAATGQGGNSGKGGDLLYRWGNPLTYDRGTEDDVIFSGQHDAQWIEDGFEDEGKLMVFNNLGGSTENSSTIEIWTAPMDEDENYIISETEPFGPTDSDWTFEGEDDTYFYSVNVSGVQRLSNGNTLICEGREGRILEINSEEELVWEYINPILPEGPILQGEMPINNTLFRAYKYNLNYSAFIGKDLTPGMPLELEPVSNTCGVTALSDVNVKTLKISPNPTEDKIRIEGEEKLGFIFITNLLGEIILTKRVSINETILDLTGVEKGIYFIHLENNLAQKIIKL